MIQPYSAVNEELIEDDRANDTTDDTTGDTADDRAYRHGYADKEQTRNRRGYVETKRPVFATFQPRCCIQMSK